ncbi:MAG: hypothetical protein JWQ91_1864 [Aeromicrobium sp.]|jgi:hypothetical protein|uniref:hypothetical protein n=1 Tax=Aeromicrobium sp. TaxID=1871063 RepID=UPI0026373AA4|nr:hypothetical protein [Aeromicrobium sp.]MCW2824947.1 hypothetical protein [Aeromicrobium sp.]
MRTAAVALLLLLGACGGAEEPAAKAPATTTATTPPAAAVSTVPATGTPAPQSLSGFRCEKNDDDDWTAKGVLANTSKAKATFQVTVYIGSATGGAERAKTRQVPSVAPGGSVGFMIKKVPAPDDGGTCHVQVLASK